MATPTVVHPLGRRAARALGPFLRRWLLSPVSVLPRLKIIDVRQSRSCGPRSRATEARSKSRFVVPTGVAQLLCSDCSDPDARRIESWVSMRSARTLLRPRAGNPHLGEVPCTLVGALCSRAEQSLLFYRRAAPCLYVGRPEDAAAVQAVVSSDWITLARLALPVYLELEVELYRQ